MKYPLTQIDFLDHAQGTAISKPVKSTVWGLLTKEDEDCYYIMCWGADEDVNSENADVYVILKSTVLDVETVCEIDWPT